MNKSGLVFPSVLRQTGTPLERIVVVCDTLDLPPGMCRLRTKGSSAGHRGLSSIIHVLNNSTFMRLFIGIGRPQDKEDVVSYVLGIPQGESALRINQALDLAVDSLLRLLREKPERVMNDLNVKNS
jgi:PTH1 family peptidyl-tRNA hydrolase